MAYTSSKLAKSIRKNTSTKRSKTMARIQIQDIDAVIAIEHSELAAVYGAGLFSKVGSWLKKNWKSVAKTVFSLVPINKSGSFLGGTYNFSANKNGVSGGWSSGSFNLGFNLGF